MTTTAKQPTREDKMIAAVANVDIHQVKRILDIYRVFDLMEDLQACHTGTGLKVIDGKVIVDWIGPIFSDREIELPDDLWNKIEELDADIIEFLDSILKAWKEAYGHAFPAVFHFGKDAQGVLRDGDLVVEPRAVIERHETEQ